MDREAATISDASSSFSVSGRLGSPLHDVTTLHVLPTSLEEEPPRYCPRRELIWSSQDCHSTTLEEVSQQFGDFLGLYSEDDHSIPLQRLRGRDTPGLYHKCSGYIREEITLTSSILGSAIIMHEIPTLREICLVCGLMVSEGDIFSCDCGAGACKQSTRRIPDYRGT